jgi:hypothetical protein
MFEGIRLANLPVKELLDSNPAINMKISFIFRKPFIVKL